MRDLKTEPRRLALNTATLGHMLPGKGAGWSPEQIIDACAARNFGGITFWRREIGRDATRIGERCRSAGLQVTGLCRSPFIVGPLAPSSKTELVDDFKSSIDMAGELGAACLVVVTGGIIENSHSMEKSLDRAAEIIAEMAPLAEQAGTTLALEPLNPVYGGNRSCLVTVRDAVDLCDRIGHPSVKIAVDVYHVWWDRRLAHDLKRAGGHRIAGYHLCDWLADTSDVLLDRGMMGDGVADLRQIRQAVEDAGYDGCYEVEIFSENNWWKRDPAEVLDMCRERFETVC